MINDNNITIFSKQYINPDPLGISPVLFNHHNLLLMHTSDQISCNDGARNNTNMVISDKCCQIVIRG